MRHWIPSRRQRPSRRTDRESCQVTAETQTSRHQFRKMRPSSFECAERSIVAVTLNDAGSRDRQPLMYPEGTDRYERRKAPADLCSVQRCRQGGLLRMRPVVPIVLPGMLVGRPRFRGRPVRPPAQSQPFGFMPTSLRHKAPGFVDIHPPPVFAWLAHTLRPRLNVAPHLGTPALASVSQSGSAGSAR